MADTRLKNDVIADLDRLKAAITADNWCQGGYAMADGRETVPEDPRACKWCLLGHVGRLHLGYGSINDALRTAMEHLTGTRSFVAFNDAPGRTVADIHALIEEAKSYV